MDPGLDDIDKTKNLSQLQRSLVNSIFPKWDKNKTTAVSSNPSLVATQIDNGLFDMQHAVPCSRRKKQIYHLVPVASESWTTEEYNSRFHFVQEELKKAVDSHPDLRDRAPYFTYSLHMVGTTPYSAIPSIVIVCKSTDVKPLRDLFRERAREKLYCGKQSKAFKLFKERPQPSPAFNLVYYRTDQVPLNRSAICKEITADVSSSHTLCGALVQYGGTKANIGLTFRVGAKLLSTTVDHLFGMESTRYSSQEGKGDDSSIFTLDSNEGTINGEDMVDSDERTINDEDLISLNTLWIDDSEEDDLADHDPTYGTSHGSGNQSPTAIGALEEKSNIIYGKKVNGPISLAASEPFLDCALLEMEAAMLGIRSPNLLYLHGPNRPPITLSTIAALPRFHGVPVYMLSGNSGIRTGRLLSGDAYLGSKPGQDMCLAWTMILDGRTGLIDGDSGSVVVDQENFDIYGHVVGSSPLQHAYVVPFKYIIEQIKIEFATPQVQLVGPTEYSARHHKELNNCKSDQIKDSEYAQEIMDTNETPSEAMHGTLGASSGVHSYANYDSNSSACDSLAEKLKEVSNAGTMAFDAASTELDNLRSLLQQNMLKSVRIEAETETPSFLPLSTLKRILTKDRIQKFLFTLSTPRKDLAKPIHDSFLKVFAILICIGKSESIVDFLDQGLSDQRLPFPQDAERPIADSNFERDSALGSQENLTYIDPNTPSPLLVCVKGEDFGRDSAVGSQEDLTNTQPDTHSEESLRDALSKILSDSSSRQRFLNEQWKFIPHCFREEYDAVIPDNAILPFMENRLIRTSADSRVYSFKIYPEYNFLNSVHTRKERDKPPVFALKTFSNADRRCWEEEMEAFKLLKNQPHMVKCYGSFTYRNTRHIILEYSEENLETYFMNTPPPAAEKDFILFWSNLIKIVRPLQRLHEAHKRETIRNDMMESQGDSTWYHADIKPANILVLHSGTSDFDVEFKSGGLWQPAIEECGGDSSSAQQTERAYDLWSFGSLVSEVMTWSGSDTAKQTHHSKAQGHWINTELLNLLERISKQEMDLDALLQWSLEMTQKFKMRLAALQSSGPDYATRWASNRRLVDSLLEQDHLRCPVVDPPGGNDCSQKIPVARSYVKGFLGFRNKARRVRNLTVNALSSSKRRTEV
jgi:hypothetical protein